ncbi:alpha/beta hydrolase family protein [Thalassotalea fusca]
MKKITLLTVISTLLFSLQSKADDRNKLEEKLFASDLILGEVNCFSDHFSSYENFKGMLLNKRKTQTKEEVKTAEERIDKLFGGKEQFEAYKTQLECRFFAYDVDGVTVNGYLIKPKSQPNEKLPVLVYNRGGNGNFGAKVFGHLYLQFFPIVQKGFILIGSQYRGTGEQNPINQDEFGGVDVQDVTTLIDIIPSIKDADPKRIGMFGASRGGMQTFLTLKTDKGPQVKAAAAIAGASDLEKGLVQRPEMERVYKARIPQYAKNKTDELLKRSVIKWVKDIPNIPVLLLHGDADRRVDVEHSIELAKKFDDNNITNKLVIYPKGSHSLMEYNAQVNEELVNWFKRYL